MRLALLSRLTLVLLLGAVSLRADDYAATIAQWRSERVGRLTAPDGWLSLIGLHWLQLGDNTVGSAEDNRIRLSAGAAYLGTVHLTADGKASFLAAPASLANVDGVAAGEHPVELSYGAGKPSLVAARNVSFFVIKRGEKIGLRVRDSESARRTGFAGIDYFEIDPSWRIEATWVAFEQPRMIPITNVLGQTSTMPVPGKAVFTRDGRTIELLPVLEGGPDEPLFFIIADETSGTETYGASRFLYAEPPKDGKIVLDFNRAQNPPCAFTPFATCPLPPKENRLPIRVTAGEKVYRGETHE
ncbi:MAG: DUF1684 domain-containing protein [Opitutae bacterium]|nr:DUF1684 domain-containing protein [Opitutae bacterium]